MGECLALCYCGVHDDDCAEYGSVMFPKPQSRAADRKATKREAEKHRQMVYSLVRVRDKFRCRHCGTTDGVEVHHIKFRSVGGEDSTKNLALLCRCCHNEIHAYRLAVEGNANMTLKFYRSRDPHE